MDKNKKVSFDIIVYSMMIVAVIYAIVQSLSGHNNEIYYKLILGIWILLAVVLSDFVEPMINRTFEEFQEDRCTDIWHMRLRMRHHIWLCTYL